MRQSTRYQSQDLVQLLEHNKQLMNLKLYCDINGFVSSQAQLDEAACLVASINDTRADCSSFTGTAGILSVNSVTRSN